MKKAATYLVALAALAMVTVLWLVVRSHRAQRELLAQASAQVAPIEATLSAGGAPTESDLERLAADPQTRVALYESLSKHRRADLFPAAFLTQDALAESVLTTWLMHPNELGAAPDEIEFATEVERSAPDGTAGRYRVYRFRKHPPHWSAKRGWRVAVAGVYGPNSPPATLPTFVFSTFEEFSARTPAEHVQRALEEGHSITVAR